MKKDKKVWYWILFLIFFEALLFSYCYQSNPEYFMFESILLVLGIGAVCFLSELLITWMIILSFALSIFILVSGVVYISLQDTLVLIFSFPLLLGICIVGKKGCKIIAKTLAKKIKSDKTIAPLNQKKIQE